MLTIAVCDDDLADLDRIMTLVREWSVEQGMSNIAIRSFVSPYDLIDAVSGGETVDIFLLDILMPDMTGIALGQRLHSILVEPMLIFLTNSEDYYPDAFSLYAFQYLCKPIGKGNLFPVLDKAFTLFSRKVDNIFSLKTAQGIFKLPLHQIMYVELSSHICYFHLSDGRCLKSLYLRNSFDQFIAPLLSDVHFIKTHTAFVVNLSFAGKLSTGSLALTDAMELPVSRTFAKEVQKQYMAYGLRDGGDE